MTTATSAPVAPNAASSGGYLGALVGGVSAALAVAFVGTLAFVGRRIINQRIENIENEGEKRQEILQEWVQELNEYDKKIALALINGKNPSTLFSDRFFLVDDVDKTTPEFTKYVDVISGLSAINQDEEGRSEIENLVVFSEERLRVLKKIFNEQKLAEIRTAMNSKKFALVNEGLFFNDKGLKESSTKLVDLINDSLGRNTGNVSIFKVEYKQRADEFNTEIEGFRFQKGSATRYITKNCSVDDLNAKYDIISDLAGISVAQDDSEEKKQTYCKEQKRRAEISTINSLNARSPQFENEDFEQFLLKQREARQQIRKLELQETLFGHDLYYEQPVPGSGLYGIANSNPGSTGEYYDNFSTTIDDPVYLAPVSQDETAETAEEDYAELSIVPTTRPKAADASSLGDQEILRGWRQ